MKPPAIAPWPRAIAGVPAAGAAGSEGICCAIAVTAAAPKAHASARASGVEFLIVVFPCLIECTENAATTTAVDVRTPRFTNRLDSGKGRHPATAGATSQR